MRTLYHFPQSPFSRRTRLALAHKRVEVQLVDARADAAAHEKAKRLWPPRTIPVLVEEDGRAIGDSTGIAHYLDAAYPGAPLWPTDRAERLDALSTASLVDYTLGTIIDLGTRYYALKPHDAWKGVQDDMLGRAQSALDALGERAQKRGPQPMTSIGWSAVDMWLYTMIAWLEGLPARAGERPAIAQIVSLPWAISRAAARWADGFGAHDAVRVLG